MQVHASVQIAERLARREADRLRRSTWMHQPSYGKRGSVVFTLRIARQREAAVETLPATTEPKRR